jgi:hypothetical protein
MKKLLALALIGLGLVGGVIAYRVTSTPAQACASANC